MPDRSEQLMAAPAARRVRHVLSRPGLHAYEATYAPCARLPEHGHTRPFFTYVLPGSYVETAGQRSRQCSRGAVIFHDHESHTNEVGPAGTASFNVELEPELWRELNGNISAVAALAGRVFAGDMEWPAMRVWREFHRPDTASTLAMEEAIALLCDAAQVARHRGEFEPHSRLDACVAYLETHLLESHRLADVARIARIHPMTLAKLFRRRFGFSMGEYLRQRRIAWACEQLVRSEATIAAIAHDAGFADHAHFTRTFVRLAGFTPHWYRTQIKAQ